MSYIAGTKHLFRLRFGKFPRVPKLRFTQKLALALGLLTTSIYVWMLDYYFPFFLTIFVGILCSFTPTIIFVLFRKIRDRAAPWFRFKTQPGTLREVLSDHILLSGILWLSTVREQILVAYVDIIVMQGYPIELATACRIFLFFVNWLIMQVLWEYNPVTSDKSSA